MGTRKHRFVARLVDAGPAAKHLRDLFLSPESETPSKHLHFPVSAARGVPKGKLVKTTSRVACRVSGDLQSLESLHPS